MENFQCHCPRCHSSIPNERINSGLIVCPSCGWMPEDREGEMDFQSERRFVWAFAALGVLLATAFIHAAQWDKHFFAVIPLKVGSLIGANDSEDYRKLADICAERMKYICQEEALSKITVLEPENQENWVALGNIRRLLGRLDLAEVAYLRHIQLGGLNTDAPYFLARIYDLQQRYTEAKKFFDMALEQRPMVIQTTVVHDYVGMLMKIGEFKNAKKVIESVRRKSPYARSFMAKEFDAIKKHLNSGRS